MVRYFPTKVELISDFKFEIIFFGFLSFRSLDKRNMSEHETLEPSIPSRAEEGCSLDPMEYRMSISKADDQAIQRAPKVARAENLQLHQMLLDEPPSIEISNQSMGLNSIRIMFELHNYAWALARGAHLHCLRAYSLRFTSCLTQRLDADSGLRPPSILEAQSADKHLWHLIQDLCVDQDSMMHFMSSPFKGQTCLRCSNPV